MNAAPASAETQVMRVITGVLGISTVVFLALTWSAIAAESPLLLPAWQVAAVSAVFGLPPVLGLLAARLGRTALRALLGSYAVLFSLVVLTFVPAMTGPPVPMVLSPWPVLITAIGTVPAALAWRPLAAWVWLIANSLIIAPVRYLAAGSVDWSAPLQYAFFTIAFGGIFSGLTLVALSNGRALDAAAEAARTAAAGAAAAAAREQEQARLDALVHDEVISTLFGASQNNPELAASVRRQAAQAIAHLARLREEGDAVAAPVDVAEFTSRMRSVVLELSPDITFAVRGTRTSPLPPAVAVAFAEATVEAARNSLLHAGARSVERSVSVWRAEDRIRVTVSDDGQGFDPQSVSPHRLGLAVSIRGRLDAIGGTATVTSRPGHGTRVVLEWVQR